MIHVSLSKEDLVVLCKSIAPPYGGDIYSEFCGNQWNEDWKWKDDAFNDMTENQLWAFYQERKGG